MYVISCVEGDGILLYNTDFVAMTIEGAEMFYLHCYPFIKSSRGCFLTTKIPSFNAQTNHSKPIAPC